MYGEHTFHVILWFVMFSDSHFYLWKFSTASFSLSCIAKEIFVENLQAQYQLSSHHVTNLQFTFQVFSN